MEAASERSGKDVIKSAGAEAVVLGPNRRPIRQVIMGGMRDAIFAC